MKAIKLCVAVPVLWVLVAFTTALPSSFVELLDRGKMGFAFPQGFMEVPVVNNQRQTYSYAVKQPSANFEVRYAVRPMDNLLKEYHEKERGGKQDANDVNPNKWYAGTFNNTLLTISGGQNAEVTVIDKLIAKKEYNADWAAFSYITPSMVFAGDYTFCKVLALHKDNCADAYYFFLSDSKQHVDQWAAPVAHTLKFK